MKNGRIPSIKAKLKTKNQCSSLSVSFTISLSCLSLLSYSLSLSLLHYLTHAHIISLLPSVSVSNYQFFSFPISTPHNTYRPILSPLNHSCLSSILVSSTSPFFFPSLNPSNSSQVLLSSILIYHTVNLIIFQTKKSVSCHENPNNFFRILHSRNLHKYHYPQMVSFFHSCSFLLFFSFLNNLLLNKLK